MWKTGVAVFILAVASGQGLRANPGHEVTVAELSAQIAQNPGLPELYFQRAWNYREMQRMADARVDWQKTLELNPHFLPAHRELALADAAEGKPDEAIARLRKAMAEAPAEQAFHRSGCFAVLSELLLKQGQNEDALKEAQAGLDASPELLWDLCQLKSEAQRRLGRLEERVADLSLAKTKLKSFVVQMKWHDAMIDAGHGGEILAAVDEEIENTRYHAAWRIRRARIRLQAGDQTGATADLTAAMVEIATRLRPENPDLSLICERGQILTLQGNLAAAAADLALARTGGADFWMCLPLEALLTEKTPASVPKPPQNAHSDGNSDDRKDK